MSTFSSSSSYVTIATQAVGATTTTPTLIQQGWDFVNANATSTATKAITFPTTFATSILMIQYGVIGARTSGDPSAITDFNIAIANETIQVSSGTIATSGFTIQLYKTSNFTTGTRYGFWWIAYGT